MPIDPNDHNLKQEGTSGPNTQANARTGHLILMGLGGILILAWAVFAGIFLQEWFEAREVLATQPTFYEVSDQGLFTLLSIPLLGIFAVWFARHTSIKKAANTRPGRGSMAGLSVLALSAVALPLAVISDDMQWYVNSASDTPYILCKETRHGKGKNTWRSYVFAKAEIGCPALSATESSKTIPKQEGK